ncbi:hypothetical protein B8W90_13265, partial [Staphylococcus hominis]
RRDLCPVRTGQLAVAAHPQDGRARRVSTPADPSLWTPAQQSWPQAMGYTVFVDGSVEPAPDVQIELGAAPATDQALP